MPLPHDQLDAGGQDFPPRQLRLPVVLMGLWLRRELFVLRLADEIPVMTAAARSVRHMVQGMHPVLRDYVFLVEDFRPWGAVLDRRWPRYWRPVSPPRMIFWTKDRVSKFPRCFGLNVCLEPLFLAQLCLRVH